ncbi:N/A [soil metagenome]
MNRRHSHRGFSLIEVLVTLVIVAIALLGLLAMQTRALSVQSDSAQQRAAAELVSQMRERISSNFQGYATAVRLNNGAYTSTLVANTTLSTTPPACGSSCDPVNDVPGIQILQWFNLVQDKLRKETAVAAIAPFAVGADFAGVDITVGWYEANAKTADPVCAARIPAVGSNVNYRCLSVRAYPG